MAGNLFSVTVSSQGSGGLACHVERSGEIDGSPAAVVMTSRQTTRRDRAGSV
jgi:hypothetical protein